MEPSLRSDLSRLFAPRSVAVVGASSAPEKAGHQALLALGSFAGDVFPINPKAPEILGYRAFPSLRAVTRPIDLVVFAIPAAACVDAVREAIECGCGGGLVVSGGFAEAGAGGAAIQAELEALCLRSAFRLLGPNTAGFINNEISLTASFVPGASRIPDGAVAVVAQSAGVNLTVSFLLAKLGYGVSLAVGLGNAFDVGAADVLEFLAEQPRTRAIALHLEGVRDGRRLYETLRRVTPRKPVIALTVGREDVAEFAQSHTGNLLGSYAARLSALRQAGAVVVESTDELALAAAVLSRHRLPPKRSSGIGILTAQAGPGLLMLDQLKSSGVAVPTLTDPTRARIERLLPPMTYLQNPVDTGRPGPSFAEVLAALAEDERIDAVVAYALDEPAALRPQEVLPRVAERFDKPILFGTMGPPEDLASTRQALRSQGIHLAESPEQLAKAAIVLARDAAQQAQLVRSEPPVLVASAVRAPEARDEHAAKQVLEAIGVPVPRRIVCASHAEARAALQQLEKPVVAKILAPEISHKTELGGVHLNIEDEPALDRALGKLDAIPLTSARRYLLEEMAPPGLELIVGAVRDPSFGPTVMVGLGGTFAEALKDTATRLAPATPMDARAMLDELRAATLLDGWRGSPPLDRHALAQAIVSVGSFLCAHPGVTALEINPLRLYPSGVLALDALLH
jgi:acyl-CoA synthetase (NDP forming)